MTLAQKILSAIIYCNYRNIVIFSSAKTRYNFKIHICCKKIC